MVANGTTLHKVEVSWDDVFSGTRPETPARQVWREAVATVAERTKTALPACNGRIEKAVAMVLAGDVELLDGGKAKVASQSNGTMVYHVVTGQHTADVPATPLPEAPASVNVYIERAGRKVQVTLRDSDETRVLHRLDALLTRFPAADESTQEPPEGWCSTHDVQMTRHSNAKGAWWSRKTAEGWCYGK